MLELASVLLAVDDVEAVRIAWAAVLPAAVDGAPADAVIDPDLFDETGVRYVSSELVNRINSLVELVGEDQVDPAAYRLCLAVDDFARVWVEWAAAVAGSSSGQYTYRSRPDAASCWDSWRRVMEATKPRTYRLAESIDVLTREQNISHNQIASIYGWVRPDGSADIDKVLEEIAAPGKHYNPTTWVSPEVARHAAGDAREWESRRAVDLDPRFFAADPRSRSAAAAAPVVPAIAPEPIHELLAMDGMTVEQVARMKQLTVEEVTIIRQQLARPASPSDRVEAGASPIDAHTAIDRGRPAVQSLTGTLAGDVIAIAAESPEMSAAEIAGRLLDRWPSASVEIVGAIADAARTPTPHQQGTPPSEVPPPSGGSADPKISSEPAAGGGGTALNHIQFFGTDLVSLEKALVKCSKKEILEAAVTMPLVPQVGISRRSKSALIEEMLSAVRHSPQEALNEQ